MTNFSKTVAEPALYALRDSEQTNDLAGVRVSQKADSQWFSRQWG